MSPRFSCKVKKMLQLLVLLTIRTGLVAADDTLYISPISVTRRENETVTLDCFTSRNLDDHYITWGSAKPADRIISWILYWTPGSRAALYSSVATDRFTGLKDWTSRKFSLTITDLGKEDSARYYCGSSNIYFPYSTDWSGCGVTLNVKPASSPSPPSVYFHNPHSEDILQQQNITLLCVAENFYPDSISISWYTDGSRVHSGVSHSASLLDANDTYTKISRLTIATSQWIKGSVYSCQVSHGTLPSPITKHISYTERYPVPPMVYVLPPTFEEIALTERATLVCLAAAFFPAGISFRWFVDGNPAVTNFKSYAAVLNTNGTYSSRSELITSAHKWNLGSVYSCEIQHVSVPDGIIQSTNKTLELTFLQPMITPIKLQTDDARLLQTVTLACFVSGFYPGDIYVTWRTEGGSQELGRVTNFPVMLDRIGTYSTVSQMTIPLSDIDRTLTYVCVVGHESLAFPKEKRFQISGLSL